MSTAGPRPHHRMGTHSPQREALGHLPPQQWGHSRTKPQAVICFQPRAQTVPLTVCVHTRACRGRGCSHCLAGSPGPRGTGGGEFPWPEVLCSLRGARTPRGDGTAVDAPGASPGCSEHVLLHKVTYVHEVRSGRASPSPLLSLERDVHLRPSCSPTSLLPGSPPTPPAGHPAWYRMLPARPCPGSPVSPSARRGPALPSDWSARSPKLLPHLLPAPCGVWTPGCLPRSPGM